MWNNKIKLLCRIIINVYILIHYFSCSFIDFSPLEVDCINIAHGGYFSGEEIIINFSLKPEEQSINELLVLQRDKLKVDFETRHEEGRVFLKPIVPWQKGLSYSVQIQGQMGLAAGGSHEVNFFCSFTYGQEGDLFQLVEWKSPSGENVGAKAPLVLHFDKAINAAQFAKSFSVEPQVSHSFLLDNGDKTVVVVPEDGWEKNQRYLWNLSNLESQNGVMINRDYEGDFIWGIDTELPCVKGVHPCGLDGRIIEEQELGDCGVIENQAFGVIFSKDMDFDSVRSGIYLEPNLSGQWQRGTSNNEFLWIPEENWATQQEYRLVISTDVKDTSGLTLKDDWQVFFSCENEFLQVELIQLGDETLLETMDNNQIEGDFNTINLSEDDFLPTSYKISNDEQKIITKIIFSSGLDKKSLGQIPDFITMEPFFPLTASYPVLEKVQVKDDSTVFLHWSGFSPSSNDVDNYYALKIQGGPSSLQTSFGTYLKEDLCLIIHVT